MRLAHVTPNSSGTNLVDQRLTNAEFSRNHLGCFVCVSDVTHTHIVQLGTIGPDVLLVAERDQVINIDTPSDSAEMVELDAGCELTPVVLPDDSVRSLVATGVEDSAVSLAAVTSVECPYPEMAGAGVTHVSQFPLGQLDLWPKRFFDMTLGVKGGFSATTCAGLFRHVETITGRSVGCRLDAVMESAKGGSK